jgi:hypothetical protein
LTLFFADFMFGKVAPPRHLLLIILVMF